MGPSATLYPASACSSGQVKIPQLKLVNLPSVCVSSLVIDQKDCECGTALQFRKEGFVCLFDDSVAMASACVQAGSIQNRKGATAVTDQVLLLKRAGSLVYALAPHAQHVRQEFLRESKLVSSHPIASHQQPPGKPSVYRMESVTRGPLGDLRQS